MPPPEIHHICHSQVYLVTISATKIHIFFQSAKFSDKFFTNCCVSCATDEPTGATRAYLIYNSRESAADQPPLEGPRRNLLCLPEGPRRGHTRVTAGLDPRMAGLSSILVPNGDAQQPEMPIRLLDTWLCATPLGSILVRFIFHPRVKTRGYPSVASSRPFGEAQEISSRSF